jgi:hypothetical protein
MSPPQLGQAGLVGRAISSLPQLNESAETKTARHASTQNRVVCMTRRIVVEKPKQFYAGQGRPAYLAEINPLSRSHSQINSNFVADAD